MSYFGKKPVSIKSGGTNTSVLPSDGQLLIGSSGAYNVANLTAGSGISITNNPGGITISSSAPTPALDPVFIARLTSTLSNVTGDGTDYTIIFDTTDTNVGSSYNAATGIFTAPDTDSYVFSFGITTGDIGAAHTLSNFRVVTGSGKTAHGFYGNPYVTAVSGKLQIAQTVAMYLTASETVHVEFTVSNGTKIVDIVGSASNYDVWFAGYRLTGFGGGGSSLVGVVDGSGNTVSPSGGLITLVNGNNVSSLSGSASHITLNLTGTTNHAVQLGNGTGSLTSLTPGATGKPLICQGAGSDPSWNTLGVSGGGTGSTSLTGVLIGNGTSPISGNAVTEHYVLVGGASNAITSVTPSSAGFVLTSNGIGSDPSFQSIGFGMKWNQVAGTSQTLAVSNAYVNQNAALTTFSLPASAAFGDIIGIAGYGSGGWAISQGVGQYILVGESQTTTGIGGSLSSTKDSDTIFLVCISANTIFKAISWSGNPTVV